MGAGAGLAGLQQAPAAETTSCCCLMSPPPRWHPVAWIPLDEFLATDFVRQRPLLRQLYAACQAYADGQYRCESGQGGVGGQGSQHAPRTDSQGSVTVPAAQGWPVWQKHAESLPAARPIPGRR